MQCGVECEKVDVNQTLLYCSTISFVHHVQGITSVFSKYINASYFILNNHDLCLTFVRLYVNNLK